MAQVYKVTGGARATLPGAPLHQGGMGPFELADRFDVITWLLSSIGHVRSTAELVAADAVPTPDAG